MSQTDSSCDKSAIYDIRFLIKRGIILNPPLYKTLEAIVELKKATAEDVAKYTGRARTIESRYLSRLNKIGIVAKVKDGKRVYYIEPITAVKEQVKVYGDNVLIEQLAHQIGLPADIARIIFEELKANKCLEGSSP